MIIYFVSFSLSFYFKESTFEAFCKSSISRIKYFLCRSFLNVLFSNISLKLCTRSAGISQKICFIRGDTMVAENPHLLFLFAIAWIFFYFTFDFFFVCLFTLWFMYLCIFLFIYLSVYTLIHDLLGNLKSIYQVSLSVVVFHIWQSIK